MKKTVIFCMVLVISIWISQNDLKMQSDAKTDYYDDPAYSNWVMPNTSCVSQYLNSLYSNYSKYSSISITSCGEVKLNSNNHNQESFINYWNFNNRFQTINSGKGICWAVTTASILEYYDMNRNPHMVPTTSALCNYIISKSPLSISDINNDKGMTAADWVKLMNNMFSKYTINYKCNSDGKGFFNTIVGEINASRVCKYQSRDHDMVVCGYVIYKIDFTDSKGIRKTEYQDFIIVNDTWAENNKRQYSYYAVRNMGGWFTADSIVKFR